jgi:hypothetical protein
MTDKSELAELLKNIPYAERVVLIPQCLRSNNCKAPRKKYGLLDCQNCRQIRDDNIECPIAMMIHAALETGYKNVYIFTGGSGIVPFFKENGLPAAVLGIACEMEIREGIEKMTEVGVPSQVVCLMEDGCAETHLFDKQEDFEQQWLNVLTEFPPE